MPTSGDLTRAATVCFQADKRSTKAASLAPCVRFRANFKNAQRGRAYGLARGAGAAVPGASRRRRLRCHRGHLGYAFGGLLRCSCGERLHGAGKTRRNHLYYACRHGQDKVVACKERWVHEDDLMVWARALLVELEALKPADFARRIDLMSSNPPLDSRSAIESIDRSLQRLDQLFLWGHWEEPRYRDERQRLEGMRKELQDVEVPESVVPRLTGLVSAWDSGDAAVRRELLADLFSDLHLSQGRVVGYTPRPERRAQVIRLLEIVRAKVSVVVGGDGLEPTASSV